MLGGVVAAVVVGLATAPTGGEPVVGAAAGWRAAVAAMWRAAVPSVAAMWRAAVAAMRRAAVASVLVDLVGVHVGRVRARGHRATWKCPPRPSPISLVTEAAHGEVITVV
eukprot:1195756-Prorocentrum_minimum.AAC.1